MRILIPVIFFSLFASACVHVNTDAQTRASNSGRVASPNANQPTPKKSKKSLDLAKIDFKNYTFPEFGEKEKTFTLKNGSTDTKNAFPKFTLRKTYLYDLTGDDDDEAVSHVIADGCQMGCESSNLFYVHTVDGNQPKLLWKIAVGGNVLGGLKAANFDANEIVIEVFGDCVIENGVIKPEVDLKNNARLKTTNYTRYVFTGDANGFTQTGRELLPLATSIDFTEYRAQISFGEQQ